MLGIGDHWCVLCSGFRGVRAGFFVFKGLKGFGASAVLLRVFRGLVMQGFGCGESDCFLMLQAFGVQVQFRVYKFRI